MNQFERDIIKTFKSYYNAGIADLMVMYPPMKPVALHGSKPCFKQVGRAPYDIIGHYRMSPATHIGVELKSTEKRKSIISITPAGVKGSGIDYHQLVGLSDLHRAGGVALLLWNNAGEVGRLLGPAIDLARIQFDTSLKQKKETGRFARGSRSIPWGHFEIIKEGVGGQLPWLPSPPDPCKKENQHGTE
jgi:hypothetical protein